jgi:hypothetical protein
LVASDDPFGDALVEPFGADDAFEPLRAALRAVVVVPAALLQRARAVRRVAL